MQSLCWMINTSIPDHFINMLISHHFIFLSGALPLLSSDSKFGIWVYQRPVIIPKSISGCQPQSGASSILKTPKSGLNGHGCSLHLQNQDREPKFGTRMYQRPVIISKSKSRCKTLSGTSSILQSPKLGL